MPGKKFVYPGKAWFDDGGEQKKGEDGVIACEQSSCVDGSRDPDDFISNRIYSSKKGVGVVVEYDCAGRLNGTSTTH